MIQFTKIAQGIEVVHRGTDFNSALTCTMEVYDSADAAVTGSPFAMTQIGTTGLYKSSFTPALAGVYKVIVLENGYKKAAATTTSMAYDLTSIGTIVDSISTTPGYSDGGYIP